MVSVEQLEALIDFLERHKELAHGRLTRTKEGRSLTKRLWLQCADVLNSVSSDCFKTPDQWRLYYNEYKCKLLKRIKLEKAEIEATGEGSVNCSPLQERLYSILENDVGEPLPCTRHLFSNDQVELEEAVALDRPLSAGQVEEQMFEVLVPEESISWAWEQESRDLPASTSRECDTAPTASTSRECDTAPTASTSRECATVPTTSTSKECATEQRERPSIAASVTPAEPRRRRKRRRSNSLNTIENDPAMQSATERLEAMERLNATATRELAQATQRQAAALEAIADCLRKLTRVRSSRRFKRIRVVGSSGSESE